jgi:hypothetical protein
MGQQGGDVSTRHLDLKKGNGYRKLSVSVFFFGIDRKGRMLGMMKRYKILCISFLGSIYRTDSGFRVFL